MSTINLLPENYLNQRICCRINFGATLLLAVIIISLPIAHIITNISRRHTLEIRDRVNAEYEEATKDMQVGQVKTVTIPAEKAYGPRSDEMVMVVSRNQLPDDLNPTVGQQLQMQSPDGATAVVAVSDVTETTVTLDANHPLAGKDLIFEIELVEVK